MDTLQHEMREPLKSFAAAHNMLYGIISLFKPCVSQDASCFWKTRVRRKEKVSRYWTVYTAQLHPTNADWDKIEYKKRVCDTKLNNAMFGHLSRMVRVLWGGGGSQSRHSGGAGSIENNSVWLLSSISLLWNKKGIYSWDSHQMLCVFPSGSQGHLNVDK